MPTLASLVGPRAWRVVFAGLCAFPALFASAVLWLLGQRVHADALTAWVRRVWLRDEWDGDQPRTAWRWWATLTMSAVVCVVTCYLLAGIVLNLAYPLRPNNEATDWGGPSLLGRWGVHGAGGVMFVLLTPSICRWLRALAQRVS